MLTHWVETDIPFFFMYDRIRPQTLQRETHQHNGPIGVP
jgi:hypothetical protein